RGIGLRGYAQQDPLNEFRREAYRLYEELRGLIRHGVASSIFRVTVQRQPPPDVALSQALAAGATALRSSGGGNGAGVRAGAVPQAAPAGAAVAGSAVLRGAVPGGPATRNVTESLGNQPLSGGGAGLTGATQAGGARPGHTPTGDRIGRNDPCWCGSGSKYKKCHGR
ncbi:MAG: SEC-C metal-binding domain-containing protein, partial [Chloroflexota bacterium]